MTLYIAPVVEGQTEQNCVEALLYRVWTELLCRPDRLQVIEPFRTHRDSLIHPNGEVLTDTVQKAYLKLCARTKRDPDALTLLLILLDAEKDCPATLAPQLVRAAKGALPPDAPVVCVLAQTAKQAPLCQEKSSGTRTFVRRAASWTRRYHRTENV